MSGLAKQEKKVVSELSEDKARRDASYEYDRKSIEPVAENAFKGALGSSIASRLLKGKKISDTAVVGAGTALGALGGHLYNRSKVKKAEKAREWLANKKKKTEYAKKNESIYKTAEKITSNAVDGIAVVDQIKDIRENQKISMADTAKGALLFGGASAVAGLASGLGGGKWTPVIKGLPFLKKFKPSANAGARAIVGASKGGAIGVSSGISYDTVQNASLDAGAAAGVTDKNTSALLAAGFGGAASGALEPTINKAIGKYVVGKTKAKDGYIREMAEEIKKAKDEPGAVAKLIKKIKGGKYLPFGDPTSQQKMILSGVNNKTQPFFKNMLRPTLRSASRGAIGMAGVAYVANTALDYLAKRQQEKQMEKTGSMSGNDMIAAKDSSSKDTLDSSLTASLARKGAIAGLGYLAGQKLFGTHGAGVKGAGLTLTYSVPKLMHETYKKNQAKEFLDKNRGQKLAQIREENKVDNLDKQDLVGAYVGARVIDEFWPRDEKKIEPKKKAYNINDSMGS